MSVIFLIVYSSCLDAAWSHGSSELYSSAFGLRGPIQVIDPLQESPVQSSFQFSWIQTCIHQRYGASNSPQKRQYSWGGRCLVWQMMSSSKAFRVLEATNEFDESSG